MPRLIRVFAGRTVILLVLSWGGSYCISLPSALLCFWFYIKDRHLSEIWWTCSYLFFLLVRLFEKQGNRTRYAGISVQFSFHFWSLYCNFITNVLARLLRTSETGFLSDGKFQTGYQGVLCVFCLRKKHEITICLKYTGQSLYDPTHIRIQHSHPLNWLNMYFPIVSL